LVIDCSEELQLQRLLAREQITIDFARKMLKSQVGRGQRLAIADDIIDNNGSLEHLYQQISALHQNYLTLAMKQ
jgi:dephospho-CoA kinase